MKKYRILFWPTLAVLFVATRAILPVLLQLPMSFSDSDSEEYLRLATVLYNTGHYPNGQTHPDFDNVVRTPGYPIFIYCVWQLLGKGSWSIVTAQVFLSGLSIVIWVKIAEVLKDRKVAFVLGILLIFDFQLFFYSHFIMTESIFVLLISALALSVHGIKTKTELNQSPLFFYVLAGLTLVALPYVRPIAYPLPALLCLFSIVFWKWFGPTRSTAALRTIVLFICCYSGLASWQIHNYNTSQTWVFSSISQFSSRWVAQSIGQMVYEDRITDDVSLASTLDNKYGQLPEPGSLPLQDVIDANHLRMIKVIKDHPIEYMEFMLKALVGQLFSPGAGNAYRYCGLKDCQKVMPGYFKPSRVFSLSFIEEVFDTYFLDESFYKKKYGVTDRDKVVYTMAIYSHIYGFLWFFVPLVFFRSLTWSSCKTSSSFLCFLFFIVLYFILFTIPFGGNLSGGFRFRLPFESILLFILSIWLFKKTTSAGGRKKFWVFSKKHFYFS